MTAEDDRKSVGEMSQPPGTAESGDRRSETPTDVNIAMYCVQKDKLERFTQCFDDEEDPFRESVVEMINQRGEGGKSPLDMAAALGRVEMMKELITRGAEVCNVTSQGIPYCRVYNYIQY